MTTSAFLEVEWLGAIGLMIIATIFNSNSMQTSGSGDGFAKQQGMEPSTIYRWKCWSGSENLEIYLWHLDPPVEGLEAIQAHYCVNIHPMGAYFYL